MSKQNFTNYPEEKANRHSLTRFIAIVSFIIFLITMLIVGGVVFTLMATGVLSSGSEKLNSYVFVGLMLLLSILLGTGLTILFSRFALNPVNRISAGMNSLAKGQFQTRITPEGPFARLPMFKELGESFNKMATELSNTELLRSDFINNFSHEFKTPIVSIAGFAELLRKSGLTEEQRDEYLSVIVQESKRLSHLATNVLDMTRIENQAILSNVSRFNLSEQLRAAFLLLDAKWSAKNIEPDLDFDEVFIEGDAELLSQVWINLFDNAVKYAPQDGTVKARISEQKGHVSVKICNTGTPISEEEREKIFRKFYQTDHSHASAGNGLGLAIVKGVVELHRGTVEVGYEDGMNVFNVVLPVSVEK